MEQAVWQGRPMYYSYTACGSEDHFISSQGDTACTQYTDKPSCENDDNERWCQWEHVREVCLGKELFVVCKGDAHAGGYYRNHEVDRGHARKGADEAQHDGHEGAPGDAGRPRAGAAALAAAAGALLLLVA